MAKICLIEDDLSLIKLYSEKLQLNNHKVVSANNANDALQIVKEQKPDLILLDIMLPGKLNGFDLLETLKRNPETNSIPVIVLTNIDTERQTALEIGADGYFIKSEMTPGNLVEEIKRHLN